MNRSAGLPWLWVSRGLDVLLSVPLWSCGAKLHLIRLFTQRAPMEYFAMRISMPLENNDTFIIIASFPVLFLCFSFSFSLSLSLATHPVQYWIVLPLAGTLVFFLIWLRRELLACMLYWLVEIAFSLYFVKSFLPLKKTEWMLNVIECFLYIFLIGLYDILSLIG